MLCTYCSTRNPEGNRFCGECGQPLVRQQVTVPADPHAFADSEQHHQTTISGPSFLGLTDTSDSDETDYLLEDDRPRSSHLGWFVFSTAAIAVLAVVGWMEWQAIETGQIAVPWLKAATRGPTRQQTPPPETAAAASAPSESVSASPADQKPQSDGADSAVAGSPKNSNSAPAPSPNAIPADSDSVSKKSDAQATQERESRIAKESNKRKAESADTDDSEDTNADAEKPASKAKPVSATTFKPPDPRQNQMLISGEKYLYGRGVRQDCNQALIYFKAAAENDNAPAMSHLGAMYASGHCVTPNRVVAYKWFARASEHEPANQWISRSLNMLWRDMSQQERASVAR
jgi:hypothetical protein